MRVLSHQFVEWLAQPDVWKVLGVVLGAGVTMLVPVAQKLQPGVQPPLPNLAPAVNVYYNSGVFLQPYMIDQGPGRLGRAPPQVTSFIIETPPPVNGCPPPARPVSHVKAHRHG